MSDELNIEDRDCLTSYLTRTGRIGEGEPASFAVLPGGVSSRTVRIELRSGAAWVLKQALPKLRVAVDWFSDPARVHREALGLCWLARLAPPGSVPALLFEDQEQHVVAMAAVPQPHENWKTMLLAGQLERDHVRQFGCLLGTIHRESHRHRAELEDVFADRSFFESLRVEPYYQYSASQVPAVAPFLEELIARTRNRRLALVHGDYSPKNVLVHAGRLVLLDHEVIHWGDPAFDVGFALTHLLSKANHLPDRRGDFTAAARGFFQTYRAELGDLPWAAAIETFTVRHTLCCLLARVVGRSPLEYLDATERQRQRDMVLELMTDPPDRVGDLVDAFCARL